MEFKGIYSRSGWTNPCVGLMVVLLMSSWVQPAWSGPHEDGDAAFAAGKYDLALEFYKKSAAANDHWSENSIGTIYEKGLGVTADPTKACEWYRKAAAGGNSWGQYNYGRCFDEGIGKTKDTKTAIGYFNQAAAQGNPWANYRL